MLRTIMLLMILVLLVHLANGLWDLAFNFALTSCSFG